MFSAFSQQYYKKKITVIEIWMLERFRMFPGHLYSFVYKFSFVRPSLPQWVAPRSFHCFLDVEGTGSRPAWETVVFGCVVYFQFVLFLGRLVTYRAATVQSVNHWTVIRITATARTCSVNSRKISLLCELSIDLTHCIKLYIDGTRGRPFSANL